MSLCSRLVQPDQEVDRAPAAAPDAGEVAGKARRERFGAKKRLQLLELPGLVAERELLGAGSRKKSNGF